MNRIAYSFSNSFNLIAFAFLGLTIITAYKSFAVLPFPIFFYHASFLLGMGLIFMAIYITFLSRLDIASHLSFLRILLLGLLFPVCIILYFPIALFGSWIFGSFYWMMDEIPLSIFPILAIVAFVLGLITKNRNLHISSKFAEILSIGILLITGVYVWGHATEFEGFQYDDNVEIEEKTYHSITCRGWLGDPCYIWVYECEWEVFACEKLYQSPLAIYITEASNLVYDENVLRLEYDAEKSHYNSDNIPPILFEYSIGG